MLTIGASGSGKTSLLDVLILDDLLKDKPIVFIDPKGDRVTLERFNTGRSLLYCSFGKKILN